MDYFHLSMKEHTPEEFVNLAKGSSKIAISDELKKRIQLCRDFLDNKMKNQKEPIYGITTGFGSLCNVTINPDELSQLQKNLVMSHACGVGEEVPVEIVRLMLILKVKSLSYGYSRVRLETVERLIDIINNMVTPSAY